MDDLIRREDAIDAVIERIKQIGYEGNPYVLSIRQTIRDLPSAQPELIEKAAYIRGFEQGRTQGMIDSQGGEEMNKQRKVLITITYNEMGIIIDTKAEEVAQPTIQPRKGKWHYTDAYPHWMCCDQCFKKFLPNREWVELYNIPTNYCPNCGADMRGGRDG